MYHWRPGRNLYSADPCDQAGRRSLRILLVEDDEDSAEMMVCFLKREGHRVQTAGDVGTALEAATSGMFDLLISDICLPDGSGVDLMRELCSRGSEMPGIALSGA